MMQIDENTLISDLTVADLKKILFGIDSGTQRVASESKKVRYVYGLKGICNLFGCSHPTAQKYKDTVIKDAVFQNGKKIIVDADLAIQLFKEWKENEL